MTWQDELRTDLMRDEGVKLKPYVDTVGKITIGCGRNLSDVGITMAECDAMLDGDIAIAVAECGHWPWFDAAPDPVKRGLANMLYNCGYPRLSGFKKMLSALERGDYRIAALEAQDSQWAQQVGARAERIAVLFRSAVKE